jgi:hypothetical protein
MLRADIVCDFTCISDESFRATIVRTNDFSVWEFSSSLLKSSYLIFIWWREVTRLFPHYCLNKRKIRRMHLWILKIISVVSCDICQYSLFMRSITIELYYFWMFVLCSYWIEVISVTPELFVQDYWYM